MLDLSWLWSEGDVLQKKGQKDAILLALKMKEESQEPRNVGEL